MSNAAATRWRFATNALLFLMCLASAGMLIGLVSFGPTARHVVIRFVLVAALPFAWAGAVRVLHVKQFSAAALFGLTAIMFIAFLGAVDFANERPPYSWVVLLLG